LVLQRVLAALRCYGALGADRLRFLLSPFGCATAFTVGMEEHRCVFAAAACRHLP